MKKITMIAMVSFAAVALSIFAPAVFAAGLSVRPTPSISGRVCAAVITNAKSSSGECRAFPTPCDVPEEWVIVKDCSSDDQVRPTPSISGRVCAAVITNAKSSSGECKAFPTPCDVPKGWVVVKDCSSDSNLNPDSLKGDIKNYLEKMRVSLKELKDKKTSEDSDKAAALREKVVSKKKVIQGRIEAAKKAVEDKRKEVLIHLIDLEIKHFNNTAERVAQMPNIDPNIKSDLKTAIENAINKLKEQKAKAQEATADDTIKTLARETKDLFKTHREIVKKIVAGIHASKESSLISRAEERATAIAAKISELETQGKNVSELKTILAAARADIAAAKEKLNQKLFTEANDLLKSAYEKFKSIAEKAKAL